MELMLNHEQKAWARKLVEYVKVLWQIEIELGYLPTAAEYNRICKERHWPAYATMVKYLGPKSGWQKFLKKEESEVLEGVEVGLGSEPGKECVLIVQDKVEPVNQGRAESMIPEEAELEATQEKMELTPREETTSASQEELEQPSWMKFLSPGLKLEEELWAKIEALEVQKNR